MKEINIKENNSKFGRYVLGGCLSLIGAICLIKVAVAVFVTGDFSSLDSTLNQLTPIITAVLGGVFVKSIDNKDNK